METTQYVQRLESGFDDSFSQWWIWWFSWFVDDDWALGDVEFLTLIFGEVKFLALIYLEMEFLALLLGEM